MNGLDDILNNTQVMLSVHDLVSSASRGPVNCRNLKVSLSLSATDICRKAFVMSAISAIGCSLNLTKMVRRSGFKFGPVSRQSLGDGHASSYEEALKSTLNLIVALSSLITGYR